MNPKTTIGLVLALGIAVVGVWWAQSSSSKQETEPQASGPRALFSPALGALSGFEIKAGDAAAMSFAKVDGKWRMTSPVVGPSEQGTVRSDVSKIKGLQYVRSYGEGDVDRPGVELTSLDDPPRVVKLTEESGDKSRVFVLRIGVRQSFSKRTYVQLEGDSTVYLVDADLNRDLSNRGLSEYRGKRVAEFKQNEAVRVEVSGEHRYTLVKSDGKWTVESPIKGRADTGKVNTLLRSVSNLRVSQFVDDAPRSLRPYGLAEPRLKVAVTTETKTPKPPPEPPTSAPAEQEYETETRTIRLAFGGTAEDQVFAKIDEAASPVVFQVASSLPGRAGPPLDEVRDKKITAINTRRAQTIVISSGDASVALEKSGAVWRIAGSLESGPGGEAEFAAVDDLLRAVRDLEAIGFESEELPGHGFDRPRATIELTAEGQLEPAKLVVGGLTPSKTGAYVRNEREGFVAVVSAKDAEALVVGPMAFLSRALLRFDRARVSRIDLDRQGVTCSVERTAGKWRFVSPVEGDAASEAANAILSDLSNLRGRRVVGGPAMASDFGLDQPAVRVTVTVNPPPKPVPTTQPATQPEDTPTEPPALYTLLAARSRGKSYAMVDGGQTICEVDGKVLDDLEAELLDTGVAELEPSEVTRLAFSGAAEFAFEKADDTWSLAGEPSFAIDQTKITEVCEALRDLRAKRYVVYQGADAAAYGLNLPLVVVSATEASGHSVVLRVAAKGPGGGDVYASSSSAEGRVFLLSAEDLAKFGKGVQDFRKGN